MKNKHFGEQEENAKQSWQMGKRDGKRSAIQQGQSGALRLCTRQQGLQDQLGNNQHSSSSAEDHLGMTAQHEWACSCCSKKWKCSNEVYKQKCSLWQTGNHSSPVVFAVKASFEVSSVQFWPLQFRETELIAEGAKESNSNGPEKASTGKGWII